MNTKKEYLRKFYKKEREALTKNQREDFSMQIVDRIKNSEFMEYQTYHIFLPIEKQKEVNTWLLVDLMNNANKTIVIPQVKEAYLEHYYFEKETEIRRNSWDIPEPIGATPFLKTESIEIVFIPLLISDKTGNRIGYGKGFYDKFLVSLPKKTLKIGLNFFASPDFIFEKEPHDIPLDYLISPFKIESFSASLTK